MISFSQKRTTIFSHIAIMNKNLKQRFDIN